MEHKKEFEYLEHTADVKFRAYGRDTDEQFKNAALAMFNIVTDTKKIKSKITKSITVKGNDLKALLYNFLEDLLYYIDAEGFLLHNLQSIKINVVSGKYLLNAMLLGDKIVNSDDGTQNYETHGDIKAATYAEMEITEEYVQVVLDI